MKEGKYLEMLAECLTKLLSTDNISVRRNEKFRNNKGVLIGEVDVVIEGVFENEYIKIGAECRDRKGKQDRNWIREIIGKQVDLAEFGFTNWIAISRYGFKSTAEELAQKANIRLLVPGKVEPIEPEKEGPHSWSKFAMSNSSWVAGEVIAEIQYDNEKITENEIKIIENEIGSKTIVITSNTESLHLTDFLKPYADDYLLALEKSNPNSEFDELHIFKFDNLDVEIMGKYLKILNLNIQVRFLRRLYSNNFGILGFVIHNTEKVLGIICINEYKNKDKIIGYLIVCTNPGKILEPIILYFDAEGNSVPDKKLNFTLPKNNKEGSSYQTIKFNIKN